MINIIEKASLMSLQMPIRIFHYVLYSKTITFNAKKGCVATVTHCRRIASVHFDRILRDSCNILCHFVQTMFNKRTTVYGTP